MNFIHRAGGAGLGAIAAALLAVPRQASVYGPLDNFDVVNDTGHDTCGFEIEIEGVHGADVYRTFEAPVHPLRNPDADRHGDRRPDPLPGRLGSRDAHVLAG